MKNISGRLRFLMWEGLEVSSRELKNFPNVVITVRQPRAMFKVL